MTNKNENLPQRIAQYLSQATFCQSAAECLNMDRQIEILLEGTSLTFFNNKFGDVCEVRPPEKPDVTFIINSQAAQNILDQTHNDLGGLGIAVLKEYKHSNVHIKVHSGLLSIMTGGYVGIIKLAGGGFLKFLAENGVSSLSKLPELIKKFQS